MHRAHLCSKAYIESVKYCHLGRVLSVSEHQRHKNLMQTLRRDIYSVDTSTCVLNSQFRRSHSVALAGLAGVRETRKALLVGVNKTRGQV
jgi:hypothetical protein